MTVLESSIAWLPSRRLSNVLGFAACVFGMLFAVLILQGYLELEPCPLCIFQRVAMIGMAAVFLLAALHNPAGWGARIYGALILLVAGGGAAIAARQSWLQHLPADQVPACGPDLDYMLDVFPLFDTIRMVLTGSGDCAEVKWTFLSLSIPEWTLILFVVLGITGAVRNWMKETPV